MGNRAAIAGAVLGAFAGAGVATPVGSFEILGFNLFGREDEAAEDLGIIDPRPYTATVRVAADNGLRRRIEQASSIYANRAEPASGAAGLIAAAQADYRAILATLYAEGYYAGAIGIRINGVEAATLAPSSRLADPIQVDISVDPGPPFRFGAVSLEPEPPFRSRFQQSAEELQARTEFQTGQPARAGVVNQAGEQAVDDWRQAGFATAEVAEREVIADHATQRLDVTIRIDPGPEARFGAVTVTGAERVDPEFIAYMADIPKGQKYDPAVLAEAERRLNGTGAFRGVRLQEGDAVLADGTIPIVIETIPRKPRRFGVGATLSTTEGLGLEGFWLHRNLFGEAERLRFDASISGVGVEDDIEDLDLELGVTFQKPGVFDPDNVLETSLFLRRDVFDDYREDALEFRLGFNRVFSDRLTGSAFLDVTYSDLEDDTGQRELLTFGLPVGAEYDFRNDPLDAARGYYVSGEIKPFYEVQFETAALRATVDGRYYLQFLPEQRGVLALRAFYGTVLGGALDELPPSELFFTGGGGSVRGFAFRSNGLEIDGDTLGGRSVIEGSVELRSRFTERFGGAVFADAGLVGAEEFPSTNNDLRVGVGVGARFYTAIGPLRFDLAAPVDPGPSDDRVVFYLGIGQAF